MRLHEAPTESLAIYLGVAALAILALTLKPYDAYRRRTSLCSAQKMHVCAEDEYEASDQTTTPTLLRVLLKKNVFLRAPPSRSDS